jgi:hypothetical protein
MAKKRFVVKCLFQMTYYEMGGNPLSKVSWAERMFYILADNTDQSYRLAEELALEYECDYAQGDVLVCCRLYEISDSMELTTDRIKNGTELYTNFFEATTEEMEAILRLQYGEKGPAADAVS